MPPFRGTDVRQGAGWRRRLRPSAKGSGGRTGDYVLEIYDAAVCALGSHHVLSANPLAARGLIQSSDPDWRTLEKAPYPYHLPRRGAEYDRLCCRLLRTHSAKNKTSFAAVKWFADGRRFMVSSHSGELSIWSGDTFCLEDIKRLPASTGGLTALDWLPNGAMALIGDWGGKVHLTGPTLSPVAALTDLQGHCITGISAAPTSAKCLAVASGAYPALWDIRSQVCEATLSALGYDIVCAQWHPVRGMIATGSMSDQLAFWDPRSPSQIAGKVIMAHKGSVTALQFSFCSRYLATSGRDAMVRLWDLRRLSSCFKEWSAPEGTDSRISHIRWHPVYTSHLAVGNSRGGVYHFDLSLSERSLSRMHLSCPPPMLYGLKNAHDQAISGLDFNPLGNLLCSTSAEGKLKIWGAHLSVRDVVCVAAKTSLREFESTSGRLKRLKTVEEFSRGKGACVPMIDS